MHHSKVITLERNRKRRPPVEPSDAPPPEHHEATAESPRLATAARFLKWLQDDANIGPINRDELIFLYQFYWETEGLQRLEDTVWRRDLVALGVKKSYRNIQAPGEKRKRKLHYVIEPAAARKKAAARQRKGARGRAASCGVQDYPAAACA